MIIIKLELSIEYDKTMIGYIIMIISKSPIINPLVQGKEGRVRGNLMGKRVDFSARTVITPEKLKFWKCKFPIYRPEGIHFLATQLLNQIEIFKIEILKFKIFNFVQKLFS